MYNVKLNVYSVEHRVYSIQSTVYSIKCKVYSFKFPVKNESLVHMYGKSDLSPVRSGLAYPSILLCTVNCRCVLSCTALHFTGQDNTALL